MTIRKPATKKRQPRPGKLYVVVDYDAETYRAMLSPEGQKGIAEHDSRTTPNRATTKEEH